MAFSAYAAAAVAATAVVANQAEKAKHGARGEAQAAQEAAARAAQSRPGADPGSQSPDVTRATDQARQRLRASRGRQSTILTGSNRLGEPETNRKTILGG